MLPTIAPLSHIRNASAGGVSSPRPPSAVTARVPKNAHRHPGCRLCPICNQWRTYGQYPVGARACGACMPPPQPTRAGPPPAVWRDVGAVTADVEFLLEVGAAPAEVPRRVGFPSWVALERWLLRHGRADLANRLRRAGV